MTSWAETNWNLDFDEPIAQRTLEGKDGQRLVVKLGPPRVDKADHWACPYTIEGVPGEPDYRMFGAGVDSIDAVIAALANIGAYLNHVWKDKLGLDFYGADFLGFLDATLPPLKSESGAV
jgi:hypothetical protein